MKKSLLFIVSIYSLNASIVSKLGMMQQPLQRAFTIANSRFNNPVFKKQLDPSIMNPRKFFRDITKLERRDIQNLMFERHKSYDMEIADFYFLINNLHNEEMAYGLMWFLKCTGYVQYYDWNGYYNLLYLITKNENTIIQKLSSFNSKNTKDIAKLIKSKINDFKCF